MRQAKKETEKRKYELREKYRKKTEHLKELRKREMEKLEIEKDIPEEIEKFTIVPNSRWRQDLSTFY